MDNFIRLKVIHIYHIDGRLVSKYVGASKVIGAETDVPP